MQSVIHPSASKHLIKLLSTLQRRSVEAATGPGENAAAAFTSLTTPPALPASWLLPPPNDVFPSAEWRSSTREACLSAMSPLFKKHAAVERDIVKTDWYLSCFMHPSSLPKGPLRSTFAMPGELAAHGAPWLAMCLEIAKQERLAADSHVTLEFLLSSWVQATALPTCFRYNETLSKISSSDACRLPQMVVIPGAVCLAGAVLRSAGRIAAADWFELVLAARGL